ncbi:MAG: macro domain-containing protein, partial [Clostridia bacterium]|nr:macro domain-containing protein [Clostridia bacterium]
MPFLIVRDDITRMKCDAIVNAANSTLLGGGGVDGAIHAAAGPGLLEECRRIGGCPVGDAVLTRGYNLPAKYVIHTVGPVWRGGQQGEERALRSCWRRCLAIAAKKRLGSVAFPLISAGAYGYPRDKALQTAEEEVRAFLEKHDMTVWLVIYDRASFETSSARFSDIRAYIDDKYVAAHTFGRAGNRRDEELYCNAPAFLPEEDIQFYRKPHAPDEDLSDAFAEKAAMPEEETVFEDLSVPAPPPAAAPQAPEHSTLRAFRTKRTAAGAARGSIEEALSHLDESFSQMLLRKIDEKGMKDSECYKKANIDRKLFSKIRSDAHYRPSKTTSIAFALALELDMAEAEDMLRKAGYALSQSSTADVIITYFIEHRVY